MKLIQFFLSSAFLFKDGIVESLLVWYFIFSLSKKKKACFIFFVFPKNMKFVHNTCQIFKINHSRFLRKIKANLYLEKRKDFQKMLFSAFYWRIFHGDFKSVCFVMRFCAFFYTKSLYFFQALILKIKELGLIFY